jgi:hypothetical protein
MSFEMSAPGDYGQALAVNLEERLSRRIRKNQGSVRSQRERGRLKQGGRFSRRRTVLIEVELSKGRRIHRRAFDENVANRENGKNGKPPQLPIATRSLRRYIS